MGRAGGSLRANARAQEQRRIDVENARLLRRLEGSKPSVSHAKLEAAHIENRKKAQLQRKHARNDSPRTPRSVVTPRSAVSASPTQQNASAISEAESCNVSNVSCSGKASSGARRPPPMPGQFPVWSLRE